MCACTGYCVAAAGNPCQRDLQCSPQEYCDGCTGTCTARVAPCGRCADAGACERRNDVCAPVGPAGLTHCLRGCTGQATCDGLGPGYTCRELAGAQVCVPDANDCAALRGCAEDADCPPDAFCDDALGRCQPGCAGNDLACPNGEVCQGLRCGPPCMGDGDCGRGGVCNDGSCGVPGGCLTSADCPMGETYCDVDQRQCVPGCQVDNDCGDATKECVGGSCRDRGCGGNYHCGFGEVCDLATRQCVIAPGRHCEEGCDPMSEMSCGDTARCLSLQDEEENPIGDFCFERCQPAPNECPQGYDCIDLEDQDGNVTDQLCIRRCDFNP
ncbi:MAG: hypothetical protein R3F43_26655 [bacterium]